MAIAFGVLFPDQWITGDRVERVEILGAERLQLEESSSEGGLELERHVMSLTRRPPDFEASNQFDLEPTVLAHVG